MLYFQQQIFSFLACFSSIHIKAPNFPIIPEWLHIEENQNEYHPDALNNVHDRELQLYISQFFIVQVQRMNHQKFIWNIISLERATLSILVEWRAVEKSFDEKANDVAMTADMEARPSMEVTRIEVRMGSKEEGASSKYQRSRLSSLSISFEQVFDNIGITDVNALWNACQRVKTVFMKLL